MLNDALQAAMRRKISELHTSLPGRVEKYDYETQKANVQPLIKKQYRDGKVESMPVIVDVPVIFPRTADFSFTYPINEGDTVLLVFAERSIELFKSKGGEVVPGDPRKMDLSDAIAIPGLYPFSEISPALNNEDVQIKYLESHVTFKADGTIEVNSDKDLTINAVGNVTLTANSTTINSDVTVNGTITATGDVQGNNVSLDSHTHGGVEPGGANTTGPSTI